MDDETKEKIAQLDRNSPGWRDLKYPNGAPMYSETGMLLDEHGNRSIFDDVDE